MLRQQKHTSVIIKSTLLISIGLFFIFQIFYLPYFMIPLAQAQASSEFGTNVQVNTIDRGYSDQVEPTMTILSDGRILVGWKEAHSHDGGGYRVGFSYSLDNGTTFTDNILMQRLSSSNRQSDPWLISDKDDNTYFVWIEFSNYPEGIGVAKTTNGGESWLPPVNAGDTPQFDDKETACIDSNGTVYIVWDHLTMAGQEVSDWDMRFTKMLNGTSNFAATDVLDTQALFPYIHCSPNDTLYVSMVNVSDWETDVYYETIEIIRSVDGGFSWSEPIVIPTGSPTVDLIQVLDTDSQENLFLAYSAGPADEKQIYIINSTDGGNTWNTPVQVNDDIDSGNNLRMVEMFIGINDTIHIAWLDTRLGVYNIYYSYSTDGGATFSEDERVSEMGFSFDFFRPGDYFCLRQDPMTGDMCIVWTDGRNGEDHDIYFARQGLFIDSPPPIPPLWPYLVGFAVFIVVVVVLLTIMLGRRRRI